MAPKKVKIDEPEPEPEVYEDVAVSKQWDDFISRETVHRLIQVFLTVLYCACGVLFVVSYWGEYALGTYSYDHKIMKEISTMKPKEWITYSTQIEDYKHIIFLMSSIIGCTSYFLGLIAFVASRDSEFYNKTIIARPLLWASSISAIVSTFVTVEYWRCPDTWKVFYVSHVYAVNFIHVIVPIVACYKIVETIVRKNPEYFSRTKIVRRKVVVA